MLHIAFIPIIVLVLRYGRYGLLDKENMKKPTRILAMIGTGIAALLTLSGCVSLDMNIGVVDSSHINLSYTMKYDKAQFKQLMSSEGQDAGDLCKTLQDQESTDDSTTSSDLNTVWTEDDTDCIQTVSSKAPLEFDENGIKSPESGSSDPAAGMNVKKVGDTAVFTYSFSGSSSLEGDINSGTDTTPAVDVQELSSQMETDVNNTVTAVANALAKVPTADTIEGFAFGEQSEDGFISDANFNSATFTIYASDKDTSTEVTGSWDNFTITATNFNTDGSVVYDSSIGKVTNTIAPLGGTNAGSSGSDNSGTSSDIDSLKTIFDEFNINVSFPGSVSNANYNGKVDGNKVTWDLDDLIAAETDNATLQATGNLTSGPNILFIVGIAGGIIILLVIVLIVFLVIRKGRNNGNNGGGYQPAPQFQQFPQQGQFPQNGMIPQQPQYPVNPAQGFQPGQGLPQYPTNPQQGQMPYGQQSQSPYQLPQLPQYPVNPPQQPQAPQAPQFPTQPSFPPQQQ